MCEFGITQTKDTKGTISYGHLLSHQRDGVWKVLLEEVQHIVICWKVFKFFEGHEQGACERPVL